MELSGISVEGTVTLESFSHLRKSDWQLPYNLARSHDNTHKVLCTVVGTRELSINGIRFAGCLAPWVPIINLAQNDSLANL